MTGSEPSPGSSPEPSPALSPGSSSEASHGSSSGSASEPSHATGSSSATVAGIALVVDGHEVVVPDEGASLLDVLRDRLGLTSAKDGCSPQGQCGCCTVLVDGAPRVACVTPARRVAGRSITTLDGLDAEVLDAWAAAFVGTGASQCGFCTPGIIMRFEGLRTKGVGADDDAAVERALQAHLCRCTGWRTIVEAYGAGVEVNPGFAGGVDPSVGTGTQDVAVEIASGSPGASGGRDLAAADQQVSGASRSGDVDVEHLRTSESGDVDPEDRRTPGGRDLDAAGRRATIEGHSVQHVGPDAALGRAGFAADTAPAGALVAVPDGSGGWAVGETLAAGAASWPARCRVGARRPRRGRRSRCPRATGR